MQKLEQRLAALAWGDKFIGQFIYASTADSEEVASITGVVETSNILVVEPDQFGQKGTVLVQLSSAVSEAKLINGLSQAVTLYQKRSAPSRRSHVEQGKRLGINWETLLPITDPGRPGRNNRRPFPPRNR